MAGPRLDEIERDALSSDAPIAATLRKVVALGGRVGSPQLRDWASRELHGYGGDVELPAYRKPAAVILMDGVTAGAHIKGQQLSPRALPEPAHEYIDEDIELRQPIGTIESMIV